MEDLIDDVINSRMALKNYSMHLQRIKKLRQNCLPTSYILQDAEQLFLNISIETDLLLKKRNVHLTNAELLYIRQSSLTNLSFYYLSKLFQITLEDPQTVKHVKKNWYKKIYNFN